MLSEFVVVWVCVAIVLGIWFKKMDDADREAIERYESMRDDDLNDGEGE